MTHHQLFELLETHNTDTATNNTHSKANRSGTPSIVMVSPSFTLTMELSSQRCNQSSRRCAKRKVICSRIVLHILCWSSLVASFQNQPRLVNSAQRSRCPFSSLFLPPMNNASALETFDTNTLSLLEHRTQSMVRVNATTHNTIHQSEAVELGPIKRFGAITTERIEGWYVKALALKCPFFRRRATDLVDTIHEVVTRFVLHEDVLIPSLRCVGDKCVKQFGLSLEELLQVIRRDWKEATCRGYYVTGKLTEKVYRNDCLFDGPDPDMPVQGLRKYLNAASQLFDQRSTRSKLLSLEIENDVIVARWCFHGTMRLPWRPKIPEVKGTTTYHVDPTGLIYKHVETWEVSAFHAFVATFFPARVPKRNKE